MSRFATIRSAFLAALALCVCAMAQDTPTPSLAEVARNTRKEHAAPHPAARGLVNEEEDGPDTTGVWRIQACLRLPCSELTVTLPKEIKWKRATDEPRPVLIPVAGPGEDPTRVIQLYAAEGLQPAFPMIEMAAKTLLKTWLARPEYFGNPARITLSERTAVDNYLAVISHFTVSSSNGKFRGVSVVTGTQNGSYGFACVFREEDSSSATSTCDAIVHSAHNVVLEPARPQYYPQYYPQYPQYPQPYYQPEEDPDP